MSLGAPVAATRWAWLIALGAILAMSAPAAAECDYPSYWPSFSAAAPSASRIVVGIVTENLAADIGLSGLTNRFRLGIDEVLRGTAPASLDFIILGGTDPRDRCPASVYVRTGWRLAIAYGSDIDGIAGPVSAIAVIDHAPSPESIGMEDLSLARVHALAELPQTDGIGPVPLARSPSPNSVLLASAGLAGALAFARRRRSTRRAASD